MPPGGTITAVSGSKVGRMTIGRKGGGHTRGGKRSFLWEQRLMADDTVHGIHLGAIRGCKANGYEQARPTRI